VSFDKPEFFDNALVELRAGGIAADRARRLLDRYVPSGSKSGSADQWDAWWRENQILQLKGLGGGVPLNTETAAVKPRVGIE
jgi:hypothetical protein